MDSVQPAIQANDFLGLVGLNFTDPDKKEKLVELLGRLVWLDFVEQDLAQRLTQEDGEHLKRLIEAKESDEKIRQFVETKIPDVRELLQQKANLLRADLVRERIWELADKFKNDANKQKLLKEAAKGLEDGDVGLVKQKLVAVGN